MVLPSVGYAYATVTSPSSSLTDFPLLVDLKNLPSNWWDVVDTDDVEKIRVADGNDNEIDRDIIVYDISSCTGLIRLKYPSSSSNVNASLIVNGMGHIVRITYILLSNATRDNEYLIIW